MSFQHNLSECASPEPHLRADMFIDISDKICPMTFVHTRLALDKLDPGKILAVRLKGEEPRRNVPRTSSEQGHAVLDLVEAADGTVTLYLRKKLA